MKVDSYVGQTGPTLCVLVPAGTAPLAAMSAGDAKLFVQPLKLFKSYELQATDNRLGLDAEKALADIASNGYAIARVSVEHR